MSTSKAINPTAIIVMVSLSLAIASIVFSSIAYIQSNKSKTQSAQSIDAITKIVEGDSVVTYVDSMQMVYFQNLYLFQRNASYAFDYFAQNDTTSRGGLEGYIKQSITRDSILNAQRIAKQKNDSENLPTNVSQIEEELKALEKRKQLLSKALEGSPNQ